MMLDEPGQDGGSPDEESADTWVDDIASFVSSIRFRLSVLYSLVVFGLGGAVLGATYFMVRRSLKALPVTFDSRLAIINGRPLLVQSIDVDTAELLERAITDRSLALLSDYLTSALAILFLLSLGVGWILAGRALRPVAAMTSVVEDIQASDLSKRINHRGPDDELGRLASTFDAMLDRLDNAFHSQRRFLADTSHDLRTPLAVIRSNIDVVAADPDAGLEDWRDAGVIVQRSAERMAAMIDDLLATARLEARVAATVKVDLAQIASEAALDLSPRAEAKTIEVIINPLPAEASGIPQSIRRAVANLIDNAFAAAPEGSRIAVASGRVDEWSWVAVADEGPGIDPAVLGNNPGLGLSIVKQVVDAHGGRLAAHPGGHRGTTMVLWLPGPGAGDEPPAGSPLASL